MQKIKILSLFSGIGAYEKALERQNIPYELVNYCEIDKYASKAFGLIHNVSEDLNLGDITKVNEKELPNFDLMTWGFPCTDISIAGKQKGFIDEDGNKTRSGLYYDGLRILKEKKPKYSLIENVKALTQKKFQNEFKQILIDLEELGYNNYYKVLNAKNFGVPQNRERIFILSIRKDVDSQTFEFPEGFDSGIRLKDVLENKVDEKYYLKDTQKFFIKNSFDMEKKGNGFRFSPHVKENANIANTITTRAGARMDDNFVIDIESTEDKFKFDSTNEILKVGSLDLPGRHESACRVYSPEGIAPTQNTCGGGGLETKIICEQRYDEGLRFFKDNICGTIRTIDAGGDKRVIEIEEPSIVAQRGRYNEDGKIEQQLEERKDGLTNTITTVQKDNMVICLNTKDENGKQPPQHDRVYSTEGVMTALCAEQNGRFNIQTNFRIRKLTPKEAWRLMGFDDRDIDKCIAAGISNSQLYKCAGNSIVVNVLEAIFKNLFK